MEMVKSFRMNKGLGEASYSTNSKLQQNGILMTKPMIIRAIKNLLSTNTDFPKTLVVADLGCSSGPNTLLVTSMLLEAVVEMSLEMGRKPPEVQMNLNDLPANDFNTIFLSLQEFQDRLSTQKNDYLCPSTCYFTGVPGSFYNRLFPAKTLQFVHSSYSLHWLSQPPQPREINKGNIYFSSTTPSSVIEAYQEQFQKDFLTFLKCRSEEMVQGGRMVLTVGGRRNDNPLSDGSCYLPGLFSMALNDMVTEGIIEEEKLDSLNSPHYSPSATEMKNAIEKEGSFTTDHLELSDVFLCAWESNKVDKDESSPVTKNGNNQETLKGDKMARNVAMGFRAVYEQLVTDHFGEAIVDNVFKRFEKILANKVSSLEKMVMVNLTISLVKKE